MGQEKPLYGVKGWLLFLCLCLCVLGPLAFFAQYVPWLASVQWRRISRDIYWYIVISFTLDLAITLLGTIAGIALWRKRAPAVTVCKIYLVLRPFVALLMWLTERYVLAPSKPSLYGFFSSIVASAIWFAYLEKSERVRNTFESDYYKWQIAGSE